MAKRYTKSTLPEKTCAACGRPFTWRKKWARDWDQVKTCSERCKGDLRRKVRASSRRLDQGPQARAERPSSDE